MFVLISNCYNNYSNRSRHASSNSSNPQQKTSNTQIKSKSSFTINKSNNEPARERSNTKTLLNKKSDENNDQLTVNISNNYTNTNNNNNNNNNSNNIGKPAKITLSIDSDVGFLWSWNFMLGKRWRNQYTGDESFQDNMLTDFRLFCSNKDERLEKFYNETKNLLL